MALFGKELSMQFKTDIWCVLQVTAKVTKTFQTTVLLRLMLTQSLTPRR